MNWQGFIEDIQKDTAQAIVNSNRRAEILAKKKMEANLRKEKEIKRKAAWVMKQIPDRARKEASCGRNYAIVMSVKDADYELPLGIYSLNECHVTRLKDASKLVFEQCEKAGLKPTLESWWDYNGRSGHNIVIHW